MPAALFACSSVLVALLTVALAAAALLAWHVGRLRRRVAALERDLDERTLQVRDLSLRDPVTALRNRRFVVELMARGGPPRGRPRRDLRRSPHADSLGFFLVAIDQLAEINATYGRDSRDLVLRSTGAVLAAALRRVDVVARWDGDALLVIARSTAPEVLVFLAERLRKEIAKTAAPIGAGQSVTPTCCIGYAGVPFHERCGDEELGWDTVVALAAHALARARAAGPGRSAFMQPGQLSPEPDELPALLERPALAEERGFVVVVDTTDWQVAPPAEGPPPARAP